jgi:hypothetical protein
MRTSPVLCSAGNQNQMELDINRFKEGEVVSLSAEELHKT